MPIFSFSGVDLEYEPANYNALIENYVLDIYHTKHIRKEDVILDLGAGIGDFAILAAKLGSQVIALEPKPDDFELLQKNIKRNELHNVLALNVGVSSKEGLETITFNNLTYTFKVNRLGNILKECGFKKCDFIKMDIEGFETQVIQDNLDIMRQARIISMEMHGTREVVESILSNTFKFEVITPSYIKNKLKSFMVRHPLQSAKIYKELKKHGYNPNTSGDIDIATNRGGLAVGTFTKI